MPLLHVLRNKTKKSKYKKCTFFIFLCYEVALSRGGSRGGGGGGGGGGRRAPPIIGKNMIFLA